MKKTLALITCYLSLFAFAAGAQTLAPGGPGKDAYWSTAGKQAIGTSATLESKVWFTLAQGVMTEVYYPNVTVANVQTLQFVVVDPKTKKVETEKEDAVHVIKVLRPDSLSFQQINRAKSGEWTITKTYVCDPGNDSVVVDVRFAAKRRGLNLYIHYDPSLANTGMGDSAYSSLAWFGSPGRAAMSHPIAPRAGDKKLKMGIGLGSDDGQIASVVGISSPISEVTNGFSGISDGLMQLRSSGRITTIYSNAADGNVTQTARIDAPDHFTFTLSFASGATALPNAAAAAERTLLKGFDRCAAEYEKGWADYIKTIPKVDLKYQAQFNMAAMVLKAQEDKTVRGANVASLTVPWGGGVNANEDVGGGYHLVWSRDLYHVFTAYMALGDKAAAERALDFLFNVQQKVDGSFPQNSHLDGKCGWCSLQMDEVAYPLIMAWQVGRFDGPTYTDHVKRAADFLVNNGPKTPQERWEEEAGFSPSTIAAEIAGLVCAADIAKRNGDEASAIIYLAAADDWARNVERMTATTTGPYGDGNYYLRITQNADPDAGDEIELNNGAGTVDERTVVDAGFLELVRLGIKPADDPLIAKSVKIIDEQIRVQTPNGGSFYRYSKDGYGEMDDGRRWNYDGTYTGKGRPWPLLTGERGQYELAMHEEHIRDINKPRTCPNGRTCPPVKPSNSLLAAARSRLDAMLAFANDGLMIPEQVWDKKKVPADVDSQYIPPLKFGEGTGSATPLAWSMAQFIRLATNLKAGRNLDTPQVVQDRYKNGIPPQTNNFGGQESFILPPLNTGELMKVTRHAPPGSKIAYSIDGETRVATADDKGNFQNDFKIPAADTTAVAGVLASDGSSAFERLRVLKQPPEQKFTPDEIAQIRSATRSPIVSGDRVIFIYKGAANRVELAGDMNGWQPGRNFLQKIADGVHAASLNFAPTARAEYKFIADGEWILDPLNPDKVLNGIGAENNFFTMPRYKPTVWDSGDLVETEKFDIETKLFGKRTIRVYVPPGAAAPLPVMYLQDGSVYITRVGAIQTQRNLVAAGRVKPFIMVFVDPNDRNKEYWANDQWADFVANELVPQVDKRYRTVATRDGRATLGLSLGGVTSLWIGLKHPEKFERVGGQSSSFWVDNERVVKELSKLDSDKTKFRFYLDDGTLEGTEDTRRVNVMLRGKGYPVTYVEREAGHNLTAARDRLADAFVALMN